MTTAQTTNTHVPSNIVCNYCKKPGHKANFCHKKRRDKAKEKAKTTGEEKTNAIQEPQLPPGAAPAAIDAIKFDEHSFAIDHVSHSSKQLRQIAKRSSTTGKLVMLMDGGSTCAIVQDASNCFNLRNANLNIKVGSGSGKPHVINCTQVADFAFTILAPNGRVTYNITTARVIKGFGCDILPECFYLRKNFSVLKQNTQVTVASPSGDVVIREQAFQEVFKTFKELNQLELVRQAGIRQQYIDQSVSLNLASFGLGYSLWLEVWGQQTPESFTGGLRRTVV